MARNESVAERVIQFMKHSRHIPLIKIAELSQGAVVVHDNYDEYDVYFGKESYDLSNKRLWGVPGDLVGIFPPILEGTNLGVLPGNGRVPAVRTFEEALSFARTELSKKDLRTVWYDEPREVNL